MATTTKRRLPDESVLAVLYEQHGRIRDLLVAVRAGSGERRRHDFDALRRLLAAHETAEEMVVRPVSVQFMNRDEVAARNHEERHIVQLLARLEKLDARGPEFDEQYPAFERAVMEHLSLEEAEEFPALENELSEHDRTTMARWIRHAFALGPTHAHPGAFGSPMAQRAVTPFTSLIDHARDMFERSREHRE